MPFSREFHEGHFANSRITNKYSIFSNSRTIFRLIPNPERNRFHEFPNKYFDFPEFPNDISSFPESRTKSFSRIPERYFPFSRIPERKKGPFPNSRTPWGGASWTALLFLRGHSKMTSPQNWEFQTPLPPLSPLVTILVDPLPPMSPGQIVTNYFR